MFLAPGILIRRIRRKMAVCAIHCCESFEQDGAQCTGGRLLVYPRRKEEMVEAIRLI